MQRQCKCYFLSGVLLGIAVNQTLRSIVNFIAWCLKCSLVCWLFLSKQDVKMVFGYYYEA